MSFRRERDRVWQQWVQAHTDELVAIGIPREVWADEMTWWRFVDHGYHPPASNARDVRFNVSDLSPEQQHRLYRFLDRVLPAVRYGFPLWSLLESRFARNPTDELS